MKTAAYMEHAAHLDVERWTIRACTWHPDPIGDVIYDDLGEGATLDEALAHARSQPPESWDTHIEIAPGHWEADEMGDGITDVVWVDGDEGRIVILWPCPDDGTWDVEPQS